MSDQTRKISQSRNSNSGNLAIGLLMVLLFALGCKNPFAKTEVKKVLEKPRLLSFKDATTSAEVVNALKSHRLIGDFRMDSMLDSENSPGQKKIRIEATAEVYTNYFDLKTKERVFITIYKYPDDYGVERILSLTEIYEKNQGTKPIRGKQKETGIETLSWRKGDSMHFLQCHKRFCFLASGKVSGKELIDLLRPLILVSEFRKLL